MQHINECIKSCGQAMRHLAEACLPQKVPLWIKEFNTVLTDKTKEKRQVLEHATAADRNASGG